MAILFDAKIINLIAGNTTIVANVSGKGRLIGFATGKINGEYSDMFNGIMNIKYDNSNLAVDTNYTNIDTFINEILNFNNALSLVFTPAESNILNVFFMFDNFEKVTRYSNVATLYIPYNISGNNTIDIPVVSSNKVNLLGITFTSRSNSLLATIDTGEYLFKDKPTSSFPSSYPELVVPGNRIFVSLENKSPNSISGIMVVRYEFE